MKEEMLQEEVSLDLGLKSYHTQMFSRNMSTTIARGSTTRVQRGPKSQ